MLRVPLPLPQPSNTSGTEHADIVFAAYHASLNLHHMQGCARTRDAAPTTKPDAWWSSSRSARSYSNPRSTIMLYQLSIVSSSYR